MLTNNICRPHTSGIITYHVSDHLMSFCIVEGKVKRIKDTPKYIEKILKNSCSLCYNLTKITWLQFRGASLGNGRKCDVR